MAVNHSMTSAIEDCQFTWGSSLLLSKFCCLFDDLLEVYVYGQRFPAGHGDRRRSQ